MVVRDTKEKINRVDKHRVGVTTMKISTVEERKRNWPSHAGFKAGRPGIRTPGEP